MKWLACATDGLPNHSRYVWVCAPAFACWEQQFGVAYWTGNHWYCMADPAPNEAFDKHITHWAEIEDAPSAITFDQMSPEEFERVYGPNLIILRRIREST